LEGRKIQTGQPNENGDIEQRHYRLQRALEQALLVRGSRDFASLDEYSSFLGRLFAQLNSGRRARLAEELIVVERNSYSVNSRLIGEIVEARVYSNHVEVWYGGQKVDQLPRQRGRTNYRIDYRHIIDWLVRKPGAFASYRYRDHLFPSGRFRMAYDLLKERMPNRCDRRYLEFLEMAARKGKRGWTTPFVFSSAVSATARLLRIRTHLSSSWNVANRRRLSATFRSPRCR
jgi:hypothetical protein